MSSVVLLIELVVTQTLHYLLSFGFYLPGNIAITHDSLNILEQSRPSFTDGLHLLKACLQML